MYVFVYICICIDICNIHEICSVSESKIKPAGLAVALTLLGLLLSLLQISFTYFFSFYSNKFLVFYSLIKCQNIVGKTCGN